MKLQLVRQFIACKGNALAAKRLYRSLALAFNLTRVERQKSFKRWRSYTTSPKRDVVD